MFTRRSFVLFPPLAALAVAGCSSTPSGPSGDAATDLTSSVTLDDLPIETDGLPEAARHTSDIGWELIRTDEDARTQNLTLSPSSLVLALATVAEGAQGTSGESLDKALGASGDKRSKAYGALRQSLKDYDSLPETVDADKPPKTPVVHQANRVVILNEGAVSQDYLDTVARYHGTESARMSVETAKQDLSAWAAKHTAGLVKESAIDPDANTALVLQDAILFAAAWRWKFEKDDVPMEFHGPDGTSRVKVLEETFNIPYHKDATCEAIRLPYDKVLAMDVILPAGHPTDLDAQQVWDVSEALDRAAAVQVVVQMPPSRTEVKWDLMEPLQQQGIDLGNMNGIGEGFSVSKVAQQTVLEVTATGTVGAALTEMEMPGSAPGEPERPMVFQADRPFIMRVLDTRTGWPLFLAIINQPEN